MEAFESRCTMANEMPVSPKELVERIESLPPDRRAEVEEFVDSIIRRGRDEAKNSDSPPALPRELLDRINERRERLRREHGLFDVLPLIREFRESGGR